MSFRKFETHSYCVGGRHRSSTVKIYGDLTSSCSKVLIDYCSICNRKKSMTDKDNTKKAEGLGDFFKNLGKKGLNVSKKMAKNVFKKHSPALYITASIATASASRNPKKCIENTTRTNNIL